MQAAIEWSVGADKLFRIWAPWIGLGILGFVSIFGAVLITADVVCDALGTSTKEVIASYLRRHKDSAPPQGSPRLVATPPPKFRIPPPPNVSDTMEI